MFQFFSSKCVGDFRSSDPVINVKTAKSHDYGRQGLYLCKRCQSKFRYETGKFRCPVCSTQANENLVPVRTEAEP